MMNKASVRYNMDSIGISSWKLKLTAFITLNILTKYEIVNFEILMLLSMNS